MWVFVPEGDVSLEVAQRGRGCLCQRGDVSRGDAVWAWVYVPEGDAVCVLCRPQVKRVAVPGAWTRRTSSIPLRTRPQYRYVHLRQHQRALCLLHTQSHGGIRGLY